MPWKLRCTHVKFTIYTNTQHAHEPSAPILISLTTNQTKQKPKKRTIARCIPSASLFTKSRRDVWRNNIKHNLRVPVKHSASPSLLSPNLQLRPYQYRNDRQPTRHDFKSTSNAREIEYVRSCTAASVQFYCSTRQLCFFLFEIFYLFRFRVVHCTSSKMTSNKANHDTRKLLIDSIGLSNETTQTHTHTRAPANAPIWQWTLEGRTE